MAGDSSHVFKFVAVRAPQLATADETQVSVIRDGRADNADGIAKVKKGLGDVSSPDAALRLWQRVDQAKLEPLAAARATLLSSYQGLDANAAPPKGADALKAAGLDSPVANGDGLTGLAWDALYVAHASGPDAGSRTQTPIAALRALHFAALVAVSPSPDRATALIALSAKPAIAPALDEALRTSNDKPQPPDTKPSGGHDGGARATVERARQIASELVSSRALLSTLASSSPVAPSSSASPASGSSTVDGPWTRMQLNASTTPSIEAAIGGRVPAKQAELLDRLAVSPSASVPAAAQVLDAHLASLTEEAMTLSSNAHVLADSGALGDIVHTLYPGVNYPIVLPPSTDPGSTSDVDVHGRIKPLGIGDLKVVKETLLAYEAGEVAYIENVLKGESKERIYRTLDRSTVTVFTGEVDTKESERDTQATDRYELKREAEQTIKEDMSIKAGLSVTASYGPISATATGDFAYSTSKEQSAKTSANFARDVVDKSVSKIQTKTTNERTVTTLNEVEETNTHGLNNVGGAGHITGIYRWVDKRYRAQVYNYGVRLLLEFVVPEPAAFYRAAHAGQVKVDATPPAPFVNDLTPFLPKALQKTLSAGDLSEQNYYRYASRYGAAGVTPPPPLTKYISASLSKDNVDDGKSIADKSSDLVVPDGYTLTSYGLAMSVLWINWPKFTAQVGGDSWELINSTGGGNSQLVNAVRGTNSGPVNGPIPTSVTAYDVHAYAVDVQGVCTRTDDALWAWKLSTFDKIQAAYQALETAYDQKVAQAKAAASNGLIGQPPALNQATISHELKKLCITMMTGQHFSQFHAMTDPSDKPTHYPEIDLDLALHDGPIVQFFEQAFEWEQMTYLFYPYFWGRKENWVTTSSLSDPDPKFSEFLTAGAGRVVVPVPIAYVDAVLYMLQSPATDLAQRVWTGGEPPTLDSPLYVSLAEELRNQTDDLAGATPEGDPWEYKLPTTLVWLQPDAALPTFP